jgi:hypothetical protein
MSVDIRLLGRHPYFLLTSVPSSVLTGIRHSASAPPREQVDSPQP